jgi:hypothetical protein
MRSEKTICSERKEIEMGVALIGLAIVAVPIIIMGLIAVWQERH